jgi:hypothetical protein
MLSIVCEIPKMLETNFEMTRKYTEGIIGKTKILLEKILTSLDVLVVLRSNCFATDIETQTEKVIATRRR